MTSTYVCVTTDPLLVERLALRAPVFVIRLPAVDDHGKRGLRVRMCVTDPGRKGYAWVFTEFVPANGAGTVVFDGTLYGKIVKLGADVQLQQVAGSI
jgi:hypothetical protein